MQLKPPSQPGWDQSEPNQQPPFPQPVYQPPQFHQTLTPPSWSQPLQMPIPATQYMPPPPQPPKKKSRRNLYIGVAIAVIVIAIIVSAGHGTSSSSTDQSTPAAQDTIQPTSQPTNQVTSAPSAQPTVETPTPTLSPAQQESAYKASTTDTSIPTLDKDGNADSGQDVHFTATILNFVKDDSGNTAGANVDDPNGGSGVVQIAFPIGTDISQLNVGDVIEVWGTDQGTATGQNAFGATIQEVVISALYLTDQTTGYQTN